MVTYLVGKNQSAKSLVLGANFTTLNVLYKVIFLLDYTTEYICLGWQIGHADQQYVTTEFSSSKICTQLTPVD